MLIFILLAASSLQIIWSFSVLNPAPALDLITNSKVRFIWIFEQEFYLWVRLLSARIILTYRSMIDIIKKVKKNPKPFLKSF